MTDQTNETEQLASVTPIADAKPARKRSNRTARAQQLAEHDALARAEINAEQRADETRADAERAGLSAEATESLVAAQAASIAADAERVEFVANQRVTHAPTGNVGVIRTILDSESGQLAEIAWTDDAAVTGVSVVPVGELQPNPTTTDEQLVELLATGEPTLALTPDAAEQLAADIAAEPYGEQPTRATWKQHRNPQVFRFYGTAIKQPAETGVDVASVTFNGQSLTLLDAAGEPVAHGVFGAATKFWAIVPDASAPATTEPAETKPAKRQRAERVARVEIDGDVPAGYLALKKTPTFEQFRKADPTADGSEWLTRCVEHGETKSAPNRKAGRALGSSTERALWCTGCKAKAAAKLAGPGASAPATTEPAEPAEPSADDDVLVDPKPAKPRRSRKSTK